MENAEIEIDSSDHEYTDEVTCPHCLYEYRDSWEMGRGNEEDLGEFNCQDCGKKFSACRNISVTYSTEKL